MFMELIIRATGRCNFDCTFCSADGLDIAHPADGRVPSEIKRVINTIHPTSIIISGGEPLMIDPGYYLELHDIAKCHISITSNLKDFYYHPYKWKEVLTHKDIDLVTSFNYGDTRKWDRETVYTEDRFIRVSKIYNDVIGKPLPFIAVIDESNEHLVLDHVILARELNTVCRLNNATEQGRQKKTYPKWKMIKHYMDIINAGLGNHEIYCSTRRFDQCPMNFDMLCRSYIRACYVDNSGKLHYYQCCEDTSESSTLGLDTDCQCYSPQYPTEHVNENCVFCDMFPLCNGCWSQARFYPPEHCEEMLKLRGKLIANGWIKPIGV